MVHSGERHRRRAQIGAGRPQWARTVLGLLAEMGKSQTWLAAQIKTSQPHLSRSMARAKRVPQKARLIAIMLGKDYGLIFPRPCYECGKEIYPNQPCFCGVPKEVAQ